MKFLIINGPNLNMLGIRNPEIYGNKTYENLCEFIKNNKKDNWEIKFFQSNDEKEIIDVIQNSYKDVDGFVINPGAFTHYSYALHDAIDSVSKPFVEVHISNIYKREEFRQKSVTAPACIGQISGLGFNGYTLALEALENYLKEKELSKNRV